MAVSEIQYTVEPDPAVWVFVPLAFPWNGFDDDEQWARELSREMLRDMGAPEAVREALEQAALAMARIEPPFPGAAERYWRLAAAGGPERLAHLYLAETEAATPEEAVHFARVGTEGVLQSARIVTDTDFETAVEVLIIEPLEQSPCAVLRLTGLFGGAAFTLELIETDAEALPMLQQDMLALFGAIRVGLVESADPSRAD